MRNWLHRGRGLVTETLGVLLLSLCCTVVRRGTGSWSRTCQRGASLIVADRASGLTIMFTYCFRGGGTRPGPLAQAVAPSESPIAGGRPGTAPPHSDSRPAGATLPLTSGAAPARRSPAAHPLDYPWPQISHMLSYIMQDSISSETSALSFKVPARSSAISS